MTNIIPINEFNINKLPDCITISTMTITCNLNTNIKTLNISRYLTLSLNGILSIKYNGKIKSIHKMVNKNKRKKKKKHNFYNQLTMEISIPNRKVNVKIFKNGTLQITGSKSLIDCEIALNKLMNELKVIKAKIKYGRFVDIKFVDDINKMKIKDFKIHMINSGFKLNYEINREVLYKLLTSKNITCKYDPDIHAGVNIKYRHKPEDEKEVSVFVFRSGSIIITGARNIDGITNAYNFIMNLLNENHQKIVKKDIELLFDDELKNILKKNKINN